MSLGVAVVCSWQLNYTANIIPSILDAWLYECVIRVMQKTLKLSSYGGDSGSK